MNKQEIIFLLAVSIFHVKSQFELRIIHINDFHARFEETGLDSGPCEGYNCIGGFSRLYTAVHQLRNDSKHAIFLNAGDYFQGTLWYNLFKWDVTLFFWNHLPPDAMTVGNHEFDDGIAGVLPFIQKLKTKVVLSNVLDSLEPEFQGNYEKNTILKIDGKFIGIIGVLTSQGEQVMPKVNLKFEDEVKAVNRQIKILKAKNCFTIIVISHSGYETEMEIARNSLPGVSVVVGGHSHTLLYSGKPPYGKAKGPYPTVVGRSDGSKVLVVQAACYTQYLGNLTVTFDNNGEISTFSGVPVFLNSSIPRNPDMDKLLQSWKAQVDQAGEKILGYTAGYLDRTDCKKQECPMGNFLTQAMAEHWRESAAIKWDNCIPVALQNSRGIRTSIAKGAIKYKDLIGTQPFGNTIDLGYIKGKYLKEAFDKSVTTELLQQSGLRVVLNPDKAEGERILNIKVCCDYRRLDTCKTLHPDKMYRISLPSYLAEGGDGFTQFSNFMERRLIGETDVDVFSKYVKKGRKILIEVDGRTSLVDEHIQISWLI